MRLTHFGGVALPTASEALDIPTEARSSLVELSDGAFDQDGQGIVLRPVTITRTFKITSTLDTTRDALMAKLAKGRLVLKALLRDNATARQTFAKILRVSSPRAVGDIHYQAMQVTFAQDFPYWFKTTHEPPYADNGLVADSGLVADGNYTTVTINALEKTATITGAGTVPIRRGQLVLTPAAGASITNLVITNQTNNMKLRYDATLTAPDVLVIDLLAKSAKLSNANAYASIGIPSGQMDWMQLEVGANAIVVDVDAVTGSVVLDWHWSDTFV